MCRKSYTLSGGGGGGVKPATAMGTFLRVWRSEWAQLSRAQLANAVQRHLTGDRRVTTGVVRWWEAGQPPGSTEELQALLAVMRSHGLTDAEVDQFRQATFAACLDRHYPGLLSYSDISQSPEVVGLAIALTEETRSMDSHPTLAVVSLLAALDPSVAVRRHPAAPGTLEHSQDVAYALLQYALGNCHGAAGRRVLACAVHGRNTRFMSHRLDGQASGGVSATLSRLTWLYNASLVPEMGDVTPRLMEAYTAATEQGAPEIAVVALGWLLGIVSGPAFADLRPQLRSLHSRYIELGTEVTTGDWSMSPHYRLANLAIEDGDLREAERHLAYIDGWRGNHGWLGLCWHNAAGNHAIARGDHAAALRYLGRAAELARSTGNSIQASLEDTMGSCERQLDRGR